MSNPPAPTKPITNMYDPVEISGDVIGAALANRVLYGSFKGKNVVAFLVGDSLYILFARKKFLDYIGVVSAPVINADGLVLADVNVNLLSIGGWTVDAIGKVASVIAIKSGLNLFMGKGIVNGISELIITTLMGQFIGRAARYIQNKNKADGST